MDEDDQGPDSDNNKTSFSYTTIRTLAAEIGNVDRIAANTIVVVTTTALDRD